MGFLIYLVAGCSSTSEDQSREAQEVSQPVSQPVTILEAPKETTPPRDFGFDAITRRYGDQLSESFSRHIIGPCQSQSDDSSDSREVPNHYLNPAQSCDPRDGVLTTTHEQDLFEIGLNTAMQYLASQNNTEAIDFLRQMIRDKSDGVTIEADRVELALELLRPVVEKSNPANAEILKVVIQELEAAWDHGIAGLQISLESYTSLTLQEEFTHELSQDGLLSQIDFDFLNGNPVGYIKGTAGAPQLIVYLDSNHVDAQIQTRMALDWDQIMREMIPGASTLTLHELPLGDPGYRYLNPFVSYDQTRTATLQGNDRHLSTSTLEFVDRFRGTCSSIDHSQKRDLVAELPQHIDQQGRWDVAMRDASFYSSMLCLQGDSHPVLGFEDPALYSEGLTLRVNLPRSYTPLAHAGTITYSALRSEVDYQNMRELMSQHEAQVGFAKIGLGHYFSLRQSILDEMAEQPDSHGSVLFLMQSAN